MEKNIVYLKMFIYNKDNTFICSFAANFSPYVNNFTLLHLVGRVAAVKMFILPHILYLFRTISFLMPEYTLKSIQSIFKNYIWNDRKPRFKKNVLLASTKPRNGSPLHKLL